MCEVGEMVCVCGSGSGMEREGGRFSRSLPDTPPPFPPSPPLPPASRSDFPPSYTPTPTPIPGMCLFAFTHLGSCGKLYTSIKLFAIYWYVYVWRVYSVHDCVWCTYCVCCVCACSVCVGGGGGLHNTAVLPISLCPLIN